MGVGGYSNMTYLVARVKMNKFVDWVCHFMFFHFAHVLI